MAHDFVEKAMRTEFLSGFDAEIGEELEQIYDQRWNEDIRIVYDGPPVQVFTGPSAATNESNYSDFRLSSDLYNDELEFSVSVHDVPFSQDEVVDDRGNVDQEALSSAYSYMGAENNFDPEKERTRFVQLSPELADNSPEAFEDRWHVLNQSLEEAIDPERHFTINGYDHVYTVPLKDTASSNRGTHGYKRGLPES